MCLFYFSKNMLNVNKLFSTSQIFFKIFTNFYVELLLFKKQAQCEP
jgi:hypothetical protein